MKISAEWLNIGDSAALELRQTSALLRIEVAGKTVSALLDRRRNRGYEHITLPAYPLAEGFVKYWWWLVAGRSGLLPLRKFREGFALPDLWFEPNGESVNITAYPFNYDNPPVSFYEGASEEVPQTALERDLRDFVENVIDQLDGLDNRDTWLSKRWADVLRSMEDEDERAFCEAAGAFRIDPYLCTDAEADAIDKATTLFDGELLNEFLASQDAPGVTSALEWITEQEQCLANQTLLPGLPNLRTAIQKRLHSEGTAQKAWARASVAVHELRKYLDLEEHVTFDDVGDLAGRCGNGQFRTARGRVPGLRAAVTVDNNSPKVLLGEFRTAPTRVFSLARAIGDFVIFDNDERSPITTAHSYRQATGRAFAAELLAPADLVVQMYDEGLTIDEIAEQRRVEVLVIENHLINRHRLPREFSRPELGRDLYVS